MEFIIRPFSLEDIVEVNAFRRMDGVMENTLALFSERIEASEAFFANANENDHIMVAEVEEDGEARVVGVVGLHINSMLRQRHSGGIGIAVHPKYQGKGIGRAMMQKIIDLADNWLMLVRLELTVYTDNHRAIALYKSLGFEIEGTKKYAVIKNGKYVDEHMMGRYRVRI